MKRTANHTMNSVGNHSLDCNGDMGSDVDEQDVIDVDAIRANFPGLPDETALLNNASGTVVLKDAIDAQVPVSHSHIVLKLANWSDPKSMEALSAYIANKETVAKFMNASVDEITFGQSTTCLFRLLGLSLKRQLASDSEIICSTLNHEALASACIHLARDVGITIKWWSPASSDEDDPRLSVETLTPLLTPKTRIVACNHVSNVVGNIHPIQAVARAVHAVPGCMLLVDGVAYAPHRPIDVKALEVDFYCFSWYKVFGPHFATLYASRHVQERHMASIGHYFVPSASLGGKLDLGMPSFEMQAMCGPVARHLQDVIGWDAVIKHETLLTGIFLRHLLDKPALYRVFGRRTADPQQRVSIITFEVRGCSSGDISSLVGTKNRFRIIAGQCLAPRPTWDVLKPESADGPLRVSIVHYNTVKEIKGFCQELDNVVAQVQSKKST